MKRNLYRTLNLKLSATQNEIKQAFRRLSLKFHPDRNPGDDTAAEKFKEVQTAYYVLSDKDRKRTYDETGEWSGPTVVDHENVEHMDRIIEVIEEVVKLIINSGKDPSLVDLLEYSIQMFDKTIREVEEAVRKYDILRLGMEKVLGRFKTEEGENLIEGAIKSRIEALKSLVTNNTLYAEKHKKARDYLKRYRYEFTYQLEKRRGSPIPSGFLHYTVS